MLENYDGEICFISILLKLLRQLREPSLLAECPGSLRLCIFRVQVTLSDVMSPSQVADAKDGLQKCTVAANI
jgi:hypothetical protein